MTNCGKTYFCPSNFCELFSFERAIALSSPNSYSHAWTSQIPKLTCFAVKKHLRNNALLYLTLKIIFSHSFSAQAVEKEMSGLKDRMLAFIKEVNFINDSQTAKVSMPLSHDPLSVEKSIVQQTVELSAADIALESSIGAARNNVAQVGANKPQFCFWRRQWTRCFTCVYLSGLHTPCNGAWFNFNSL